MKYTKKLFIQSELGKLFGVSSHTIGKWLVDCGLRDHNGQPTRRAIDEKFCGPLLATMQYTNIGWNPDKTVPLLISHGHKLVDQPPSWLVQTSNLHGPFAISVSNPNVVVNSDGDFVAETSSAKHSTVISRLLDLAHKHGVIERLLEKCN